MVSTHRGFHLREPCIFHTQFFLLIEKQMWLPCTQRLHIPQNTVWRSAPPGFSPTDIAGVSARTLATRSVPVDFLNSWWILHSLI